MVVRATSVFFASVGDFLRAWPRLLTTDVIYKLIAFVVLTPLVGAALRLFLSTSGSTVVADEDILFFILSPLGLLTLVLTGAITLAIVALEQACLMAIGFGEMREVRVTVADALWYGVRHTWSVVRLALRIFVRALLIALPFLITAGLAYLLLLGKHDINYYLTEKPPIFLFTGGIIAALLGVMAVLVIKRLIGWAFSLPLALFEKMNPAKAMATSEERVQGHRWSIAFLLVAWGVVASILSALPLALTQWLGEWVLPKFSSSLHWTVWVMGGLLLFWGVVNLIVTLVNASMLALLIVRLYERLGASADARLSGVDPSERLAEGGRRRMSTAMVLVLLAMAMVLAGLVGFTLMNRVPLEDDVVIIAHRGAAGGAPENTLASVALALEHGADIVEIDVQETADGEVVVIHDSDLMKVGNNPMKVWESTFDEIRSVDVGSWFGPEFTGQRVPTLEEVLLMCKEKAVVDIELKYYGHDEMLEHRVAAVVDATGMENQVIAMSLKGDAVVKMKGIRPEWDVGLLTAKAVGDLTTAEADFLAVHVGMANSRFVDRVHDAGKDVYVWTVNDRLNMSRMMSRGVDGVITDEPALARSVLEERAEMGTVERLLVAAAFWIGLEPKEPPADLDLEG
jgi:glycerophosphoryl diester phosphodiesterase